MTTRARRLAASEHPGRLSWLNLALNDLGTEAVEALCASDRLPNLRYVNLAGNRADPRETGAERVVPAGVVAS